MFQSLKSQLVFALFLIIVLFIGQEYVTSKSQNLLTNGLTASQTITKELLKVKTLEKDVLDLQRNVLIYKEYNSPSVLKRFNDIILEINTKLDATQAFITNHKLIEEQNAALESMRGHLNDYQENFNSVVSLLSKRNQLFNNELLEALAELKNTINTKSINSALTNDQPNSTTYESLLYITSDLQLSTYEYFIESAPSAIENFNRNSEQFMNLIATLNDDDLNRKTEKLIQSFRLLTQVTRNYNYLVNVVMSGSANEFLYLTEKLSEAVLARIESSNQILNSVVKESISHGKIMFLLGILLTGVISVFVVRRLILPIQKVTQVFDTLAANKELNEPLSVNRSDEIGQLIRSATIFQQKNHQTNQLLRESQELNEELAIARENAEKATESKSMFLANMSHEIRTPMNGIIGLVDLLSLKNLNEEESEYIEKIRYSSNILMSVINDILDFSKIEAGKLDLEYIPFQPQLILENVVEAITVKASEKNINVRCHIPTNLPKKFIGDPVRLSQILLNLGNNAVKFTHSGNISFNVSIKPLTPSNKVELSIAVSDTGIGIKDAKQKSIFAEFTQADGSTNRNYGGTGLGLSISKYLTELMGGKITLFSKINEGSTFTIVLPFEQQSIPDTSLPSPPINSTLYICYIGDDIPKITDEFISFFAFVKSVVINNISEFEQDYCGNNALLINVSGKISAQQNALIHTLIKNNANVGFCCDTHDLNALSTIKPFEKPLIQHPLLPSKVTKFTHTLLNKANNNVSNNIKHEQKLTQFKGHVLLVEDNAINQIVAGKVLQSFGVSYDIAENGAQAVSKITNSSSYDLVFMDVQMPVMDGYEATRNIRTAGIEHLIVCGLSANAMRTDKEKAIDAGMNEYITKPLKREDIEEILLKYLSKQKL